jgi:hypothetical protein
MDLTRDNPEHDRLESTWDRWQRLPLGYRINACVYVLAFIALVGLLAQVVSGDGGKPRQVEVASRASTTTRPKATTTTTTKAPPVTVPTTAAPTTAAPAPSSGSGSSAGSGSGGSNSAQPPGTTPIPGLPVTSNCQDSTDPDCGSFSWSPAPSANKPILISIQPSVAGNLVTFSVDVSDGDHSVGDNCAVIDFGDGVSQQLPCQPLNCPATFGPWTPPAAVPGHAVFSYSHTYAPGNYLATFEFHSDRDRCPDPYGNYGQGALEIGVPAG